MLSLTNSIEDEESICRILEAAGKEPSDIGLEPAFKNKRDQESDDDSVTASVDSAGKLRDDKKSKIILSFCNVTVC